MSFIRTILTVLRSVAAFVRLYTMSIITSEVFVATCCPVKRAKVKTYSIIIMYFKHRFQKLKKPDRGKNYIKNKTESKSLIKRKIEEAK